MHTQSIDNWRHEHVFLGDRHQTNERRTWIVVALTLGMMVAEIVGGTLFGSMAVVADGWHMSTHALALGIAALAYRFATRYARDRRFAFGTGKLGELTGFSSALLLAMIALLIGYESAQRLLSPIAIRFDEAIALAVVGLLVNVASAWVLSAGHSHGHTHDHREDHHHDGHASDHHAGGSHSHVEHDTNLRAAFVHVLADALTSVLAIVALLGGRFYGWVWLDPAIGIVGAIVILSWSVSLVRAAGTTLLDLVPSNEAARRVRERLEVGGDRVSDLHLWRVGPGHYALIVSLVSDLPLDPDAYKAKLRDIERLSHVTVEVHGCREHGPRLAA